ncbi:MAG: glycosyltransferase, partial [Pseudomonadota bacterium]
WDDLPDGPIVWANLSVIDDRGPAPAILNGLAGLGATLVVTGSPDNPILEGHHVYAADNLRTQAMARRASLSVTNADTTAIQQSLAAGTPVLVVPEPEEAVTYAHAVRAKGACEVLEGGSPHADDVRLVVTRMLAEPHFREAAAALAAQMARYDAEALIVQFVDQALEAQHGVAAA